MNQPTISIVVPIYNAEKYLRQCVDSILNQSFKNLEMLLVDDGSTDESGAICDEYARKYKNIHVIHKSNEGVSATRNRGVEESKGEYILFMDSDDTLVDNSLREVATHIKDNDLVVFSSIFIKSDGTIKPKPLNELVADEASSIQDLILYLRDTNNNNWNFWGYPWNKIFKKSIIDEYKIRFPSNMNFHEDEIFAWDYSRYIRKMSILPLYVCCHMMDNMEGLTNRKRVANDYIRLADELARIFDQVENEHLSQNIVNKIEMCYYNGIVESKKENSSWLPLCKKHRIWLKKKCQKKYRGVKQYVKFFLRRAKLLFNICKNS